jgi:hypothetical protein
MTTEEYKEHALDISDVLTKIFDTHEKKFYLFIYSNYEAKGGMRDCKGVFDSFEDAEKELYGNENNFCMESHISQGSIILAEYSDGVKKTKEIASNHKSLTEAELKESEEFEVMFKKKLPYIFINDEKFKSEDLRKLSDELDEELNARC